MAPDHARLFVALRVPPAITTELSSWGGRCLDGIPDLRLARPEFLHVTLCFLGSRPVDEVWAIAGVCRGMVSLAPPTLTLGDSVWLPRRRPRVVAVELADEAQRLVALQSSLAAALSAGGHYEPEDRPFFGHITVARVAGPSRPRSAPLQPPPALRFDAGEVTLYRSRPGSGPARYEALETVTLVAS